MWSRRLVECTSVRRGRNPRLSTFFFYSPKTAARIVDLLVSLCARSAILEQPTSPSAKPLPPFTRTHYAMADKEKKKSRKERQRELRMLEKEISGGKSLIDYGKVNQVGPAHAGNCWRAPYHTLAGGLFFVRFQTTRGAGVGVMSESLVLSARDRRCCCFPTLRVRPKATAECVLVWIWLVRCPPAGAMTGPRALFSRVEYEPVRTGTGVDRLQPVRLYYVAVVVCAWIRESCARNILQQCQVQANKCEVQQ